MTGHKIALTLDTDGVHAEFECLENPLEAPCHQACTYGCEVADHNCVANHPRETTSYCNPIEFVENGGMWFEQYVGEETEPRTGDIVFEWQGDWYGWRYADGWKDHDNAPEVLKQSWIERIKSSFAWDRPPIPSGGKAQGART